MSVWIMIARDFRWKPVGHGEDSPYPCGAFSGWAAPASLLPDESRYEDVGCVCHTNLERALIVWRRKIVSELLERAAQVSREAGIPVRVVDERGREEWANETLPERIIPIFRELEASRESMEMLQLRMNLQRRLTNLGAPSSAEREQRFEEVDKPAPLAGPLSWTDKIYNPR
jgi:hypothetical protein